MAHFLFFSNVAGVVMFAASFGTALAVGEWLGVAAEGPLMLLAGPLLFATDLDYRWWYRANLFIADAGGSLLHLPAWQWGMFWFILGLVYSFA